MYLESFKKLAYLLTIFIFVSGLASYLAVIGISVSDYFLLLILFIFGVAQLLSGKLYIDGKLVYIILYFLLNCFYFTFYSVSSETIEIFLDSVTAVIIFLIIYLTLNKDILALLKKYLPILLVISSVASLLTYMIPNLLVPIESNYYLPGRSAGLFLNPNIAGISLVCLLAFVFTFCTRKTALLCLAIAVLPIFLTFSRSSWLFLLIILIVYRHNIGIRNIAIYGFSILLAIPVILFLIIQVQGENLLLLERYIDTASSRLDISSLGQESTLSESDQDRYNVLLKSINAFENNIFFGNGYGYTSSDSWTSGTHNMHFRFLVEMGLFGYLYYFVAYMFFLLKCFVERDRDASLSKFYLCFFILLTINGFFSHNLFEIYTMVFMISLASCIDGAYRK